MKRFGEDTFTIIEREPERLAEVKGISEKMAIRIAEQVNDKRQMRQAMLFLQDYGISMKMAVKIYKYYGDEMYEILKRNPYRLAEDIQELALRLPMRLRARLDLLLIRVSDQCRHSVCFAAIRNTGTLLFAGVLADQRGIRASIGR